MTDSNSQTGYAQGLTAYAKDGLELFIHNDGQVFASQSAMARMLEVNQGSLSGYLSRASKNEDSFLPVAQVQMTTVSGLQTHSLYATCTLVALAKKYNHDLLEKFSEMGAMVYLYQLAGYKIDVKPSPEMSEHEKNERLLEAMTQKVALGNYAKANPNFQDKIDFIVKNNGALSGKMTISELCESHNLTMTVGQRNAIGRGMAECTRKETGSTPTRRNVKVYKEGVRSYRIHQVCEYPVSLDPEFVSLCRQRGIA